MPIRYKWTPEQEKQVKAANQWIMDALAKVMPGSEYMGQEQYYPVTQPIANMAVPPTFQEAMQAALNTVGVGPMEIWSNYRTPAAIAQLRKLMAQEQRARGPMIGMSSIPEEIRYPVTGGEFDPLKLITGGYPTESFTLNKPVGQPDPADLILRGSWFHGMSPAARENFRTEPLSEAMGQEWFRNWNPTRNEMFQEPLILANQLGLPASTHAIPGGYVRFGEPYGVSLTASPSVAAKFAADENIHRIMPLYGGPPTERTLQLWKPEHQKRFNEAYNEALNKNLFQSFPEGEAINKIGGVKAENIADAIAYELQSMDKYQSPGIVIPNLMQAIQQNQKTAERFNIDFSNALQSQGIRGLLYNPRRYGEYEMLMLDPKYAQILDYRPKADYIPGYGRQQGVMGQPINKWYSNIYDREYGMTPMARKGYDLADPEFAANHARLHEMFGLMPWTERINQENWQRIMEQVDPSYREAIINQLFGNR